MKSDTHPETSPEKAEGRVDIGNWLGKRSRQVSSVYRQKPEIVALGFQMALILQAIKVDGTW